MDDSSDNNSGYVDSNVHNLSEGEEFISGNSRNKNNSSSEHDVLFEEQLEDVKKSEESSGQKRSADCLIMSVIPLYMIDAIMKIPLSCVSSMLEVLPVLSNCNQTSFFDSAFESIS